MSTLPAVSLVSPAGKRAAILELAVEIERRGFSGIACPSLGAAMALCTSLAHVTSTIPIFTSIQPIYLQHPSEAANTASHIDEISGGRFSLGIGVSHGPVHDRLQVEVGRPLSDTRDYVAGVRAAGFQGRVILAALRDRMLDLSVEVADGAVWANASRSHMAGQLQRIPAERRGTFFVGNMIPTVIDDDIDAARAVNRKTLTGYVRLPNYRNYWKAAGYEEEMTAIEQALAERRHDDVVGLMSDRWLDDCTLSGPAGRVRDGLDAWRDAGVSTPVAVMSSTSGGQAKAINELFAAYA
jgi:alkanesulfonate monooxygenase SsuD/methylene tetrahydromethanopterin reductase-like flavin-dependent oxidoreductase (luciferase family)